VPNTSLNFQTQIGQVGQSAIHRLKVNHMKTRLHISLMKTLAIAPASAAALCLALSSLPSYAQKNSLASSTPGGTSGLSAATTSIPSTVPTIQLIEEVVAGTKGSTTTSLSNTYRLEPSGVYSAPTLRLCLKYNSATFDKLTVSNKFSAALSTMLRQVKDVNGKPSYTQAPGDFQDDKANSQLCVNLNRS